MAVTNTSPRTAASTDAAAHQPPGHAHEPAYQAFLVLKYGFVALPLLMGLDKFFNLMTEWPGYLAPWTVELLPFSAQTAMYVVGVVEVVAAIAMFVKPRYASYVVAAWLALIIINLLTYSGFYDVALRDVGLLVAAIALARLAHTFDSPWRPAPGESTRI